MAREVEPMTVAEVAQVAYTEFCVRLDDLARHAEQTGYPKDAAIRRKRAAIAYNAGRAEKTNPEPEPVMPCGICRGVRVCDWDAHLAAPR